MTLSRAQRARRSCPIARLNRFAGFGRSELRDHGLRADDQLEVGEHVEDHPGVRCERLVETRRHAASRASLSVRSWRTRSRNAATRPEYGTLR